MRTMSRFVGAGRFLSVLAMMFTGIVASGCQTSQQSFATPDAAVDALVSALRPPLDDRRLEEVLGSDAKETLPSGDDVADARAVSTFLERFDRGHRLVDGPDGSKILEIDTDHWPFAFPLVEADGAWRFDSDAGLEELANRRVGANELDTIQTMLAIVDAQREYAWTQGNRDGLRVYARRFLSEPGTRDGLYWPTAPGESPSPLGDLIAAAAAEGYGADDRVYHGYRFHMLTAQGPGAPGGAMDYIVDGQLVGGFAAVAWPAEYGRSGVMTFIVNHDGIVYQKDLGPDTERIANGMKLFDPAGWTRVADQ